MGLKYEYSNKEENNTSFYQISLQLVPKSVKTKVSSKMAVFLSLSSTISVVYIPNSLNEMIIVSIIAGVIIFNPLTIIVTKIFFLEFQCAKSVD